MPDMAIIGNKCSFRILSVEVYSLNITCHSASGFLINRKQHFKASMIFLLAIFTKVLKFRKDFRIFENYILFIFVLE